MLAIVSSALPVFVNVELSAALVEPTGREPKSRLGGVSPTPGADARPVPLNARLCGLPGASSVIETEAVRLPAAAGVKLAVMMQLLPAANRAGLSGQSFTCAKSAAFAPPTRMLEIDRDAVPELRSVTLCDALVVPTVCPTNDKLAGDNNTAG